MATPTTGRRRMATMLALAAALAVTAAPVVEARPGGGGGGFGSRGSRTFSPPAGTSTSPGATAPIQRSQTSPSPGMGNPGMQAAPGRRFGGGFFAGLLGAGLLGALVGGGFFGGLGGIASFLGLLLQVGLLVGLVMLAVRFFRRRQGGQQAGQPAMAGNAPYARSNLDGAGAGIGGAGMGGAAPYGGGSAAPRAQPVNVEPADFEAFERTLGEVQTAYGREDLGTLRRVATPEMVGYFEEELRGNAQRGVVNRISDVKLLQGDLSEAWREGNVEYATVAMRFALTDVTIERNSQRVVENGPSEAKEFWTFARERGGSWLLSAIQQGR
ncbi:MULTISPECIES: TIM44-like domain-containing protein [Methylobacterium]|uniref:Tim44-like domain-containing protein n=1 Tax=Methylobacterium thuringiense TaxID=1003091 RepID=A0ABQ4TGI4_9HYPH|nr:MULTISPECIES: TIM44-like domain-containing protein [Methylobacterium]TXN22211.1 hypothetical protein FV217_11640 [Methylobacterium sp. WL9]GJE53582.1 hypothetical protein EKPJFOCH_0047 [Methylobacterium thuringiense]